MFVIVSVELPNIDEWVVVLVVIVIVIIVVVVVAITTIIMGLLILAVQPFFTGWQCQLVKNGCRPIARINRPIIIVVIATNTNTTTYNIICSGVRFILLPQGTNYRLKMWWKYRPSTKIDWTYWMEVKGAEKMHNENVIIYIPNKRVLWLQQWGRWERRVCSRL